MLEYVGGDGSEKDWEEYVGLNTEIKARSPHFLTQMMQTICTAASHTFLFP